MYENNIFHSAFNGILNKNVVTTFGIGIPLVIGSTQTLKMAVITCIFIFIVNLLAYIIFDFAHSLPTAIKQPIAAIMGMGVIVLIAPMFSYFSAEIIELGFYIPLIAVNTVMLDSLTFNYKLKKEEKAKDKSVKTKERVRPPSIIQQTFGFIVITLIMAFIRELLSKGSIWGYSLIEAKLPAAQTVFMGFLILGFLAVALRLLKELIVRVKAFRKTSIG